MSNNLSVRIESFNSVCRKFCVFRPHLNEYHKLSKPSKAPIGRVNLLLPRNLQQIKKKENPTISLSLSLNHKQITTHNSNLHQQNQNQIPTSLTKQLDPKPQNLLNGYNPISLSKPLNMNLTTPMDSPSLITDPHKLQNIPSFKLSRYSSGVRDSDAGDDPRYTSLKDILLNSPSYSAVNEFNEFNSSNISIRNELVKRAASAYLQSAAILVSRNESGFVGFWERLRIKLAALRSRWCDCFHRIFGFFTFAID